MDNIRVFLWAGFALLLWMNFQAWQKYFPPAPPPVPVQAGTPRDTLPSLPDAPDLATGLPVLPEMSDATDSPDIAVAGVARTVTRRMIRVRTDVFELEIDSRGGDLHSARLLSYPLRKDEPDIPVTLLSAESDDLFIFRTGLRALDEAPEANHLTKFTAERDEYVLAPGADELIVRLSWAGEDGISAEKIYRLRRGHYGIGLEQRVSNSGQTPYRAVSYLQLLRRHNPPERSMFNVDSYSFMGPVIYDGEKYEKLDPDDLSEEPFAQTITGGWFASIQHHFLVAAVPSSDTPANYQAFIDGDTYVLSAIGVVPQTIAPNETFGFSAELFVGPKIQTQLDETADGLALTVDYGIFTMLSQPLFWLLQKIYNLLGNWGWAIITVTILIKLAFYKLTEASGKSMAKMRKLQPRLKSLQERYKDDREALSKAMMDLYKREKVNPAAGCLPMLIQIPFFMAFYWVLLESVEMRQAPFMLWITDLSTRDPWFILPVLMGAAMYFQQKLNPAPPDPMQAKVMQFLPIMFTGMFAFFPAGLVLYWLTNSILSMAQQWNINRVLGAN